MLSGDNFELVFKAVAAYATGLIAPGYFCSRALGGRAPWSTAVPLSMLILMLGALALTTAGIPLRFGTMLVWELTVTLMLLVATLKLERKCRHSGPNIPTCGADTPAWRRPDKLLIAGIVLMGLMVVLRGFLYPLNDIDVTFRWEFLSLQVLHHQTLAFYPPVTADDFRIYFYPDGFAPVVSISYWWIYAALGRPISEAAMPLVMAQYFGALALAYHTAAHLHSRRAGLLAGAILAVTPLFFRAVISGQETGLTALAVIGMVLTLLQAEGPEDARAIVLAGLLAGAGGLAREYGLAFVICGVLVMCWRRMGWKAVLLLGMVTALTVLPWNLRNFVRSGNPLYNHLPWLFPVNPVVDHLMRFYRSMFGLDTYDLDYWTTLAKRTLLDAGWPIMVGIPSAVYLVRRYGYLAGSAAAVIALWLLSVGYTAGGVSVSMRVLSPALVLLAVAAAVGVARLMHTAARQWVAASVLFLFILRSALDTAVFPRSVNMAALRHASAWREVFAAMTTSPQPEGREQGIEEFLSRILPHGARILTENAVLHGLLAKAGSTYDLVPIWSPEVAFLFDHRLDLKVQRRLLREHNITAVIFYIASTNTVFCMQNSPFYAQDYARWKILGQFKDIFLVCAFSPPEAPVTSSPGLASITLITLGNSLLRTGRIAEAMKQYEEALRIDPDSAEAHYNLGVALTRTGRVPEAIRQFETALRLKPDYSEAHNNLGVVLLQAGRVAEAIGHFAEVVRIKPDSPDAHSNLGVALAQAGRFMEAKGHYEQALRIKPDFAEARNNLARLQILQAAPARKN